MATIKEAIQKLDKKLEKKLDTLEERARKEAEKSAKRQRLTEILRGMSFWEKVELAIKVFL